MKSNAFREASSCRQRNTKSKFETAEFKMIKYLLKHKELIPLFFVTGLGMGGAGYYLGRLALKNPDVSWDRKNNQHPWLNIKAGQTIKFFGHTDYNKITDHKDARPAELKNF